MFSRHTRRKPYVFSILPLCLITVALVSLALTAQSAAAASPHVDMMLLNSEIGPASLQFLKKSIATAENDGAQALVIEINTPGGDLESMNSMYQAELGSSVPIIAYVSPAGAQAASAGAFVTLAAHVAIMAPTTRIGASSPINASGADIGSTLKAKIENDLTQLMTEVQQKYHRGGVAPAVKMITNATSYTDTEAESQYIVDCAAPYDDATAASGHLACPGASSLSDLLNKVDGRSVTLNSGTAVTLQTKGINVQTLEPGVFDTLYALLLDPNVAFLLFVVAVIGIFLEISHPGAIVPGVVGGISLILFLFAAGSLSPNWAGLALMVLAFVLLVLDLKLPTHGVLTLGAVASLIFGALLFFNSGGPYGGPQVNPLVVYAMGALFGIIGFTLVTFIVRAQRRRVTTGVEGMIGAKAVALTPLLPEGRVDYEGENWAAVLDEPATSLDPGSEVRIVGVEGLRLHVEPVFNTLSTPSPKDARGA